MIADCEREIGMRIRYLREKCGMTQKEMSHKLQLEECNISRSVLAKIESGSRHIHIKELYHIKEVLNADWDELLN